MRAFVAANLAIAHTRRAAEAAMHAKRTEGAPAARWSSPAKLHLTLRFLGSIDVGLAPAIADVLRAKVEGRPAPRVAMGPIDAFPDVTRALSIFLAVRDLDGDLRALRELVSSELDELGFPSDPRPFVPHLTIARVREPADLRPWLASTPPSELGEARVTEVVLYRSDRATGEYVALESVALALPARR